MIEQSPCPPARPRRPARPPWPAEAYALKTSSRRQLNRRTLSSLGNYPGLGGTNFVTMESRTSRRILLIVTTRGQPPPARPHGNSETLWRYRHTPRFRPVPL